MNEELQNGIRKYLSNINLHNTLAFTGTYKQNGDYGYIDKTRCSRNNRHFFNVINKKVYGNATKRFNKKLSTIPVIELSKNNRYHAHMIIEVPDRKYISNQEFYLLLKTTWNNLDYGYNEVRIVTNIDVGWLNYITKFKSSIDDPDWENVELQF